MAHIAITLLPGESAESKLELARKVRRLMAEELGIDPVFISVSSEDVPMEKWDDSMSRVPDECMLIPEEKGNAGKLNEAYSKSCKWS